MGELAAAEKKESLNQRANDLSRMDVLPRWQRCDDGRLRVMRFLDDPIPHINTATKQKLATPGAGMTGHPDTRREQVDVDPRAAIRCAAIATAYAFFTKHAFRPMAMPS